MPNVKRQFLVVERTPCGACRGAGFVTNPAWIPWPFATRHPHHQRYDAFADTHGPEELNCAECDGKGKIEQEVSLAEALRELGLFPVERRSF